MDACSYCRKHHNPHEICDAYIQAVEKGEIMTSPEQKLNKIRDELFPVIDQVTFRTNGEELEISKKNHAKREGFNTLSPTWLKAYEALKSIEELARLHLVVATTMSTQDKMQQPRDWQQILMALAAMDKLLEGKE